MNDLISREAVIDAIRYRVCQGQGNKEHICNRGSCAYCGIMEIISDISSIPSSSGWISTKERLPDTSERKYIYCNCYVKFAKVIPLEFTEETIRGKAVKRWKYPYLGRIYEGEVFYWQPLPKAPKEKGNDEKNNTD